jgi:hypothetical protein
MVFLIIVRKKPRKVADLRFLQSIQFPECVSAARIIVCGFYIPFTGPAKKAAGQWVSYAFLGNIFAI